MVRPGRGDAGARARRALLGRERAGGDRRARRRATSGLRGEPSSVWTRVHTPRAALHTCGDARGASRTEKGEGQTAGRALEKGTAAGRSMEGPGGVRDSTLGPATEAAATGAGWGRRGGSEPGRWGHRCEEPFTAARRKASAAKRIQGAPARPLLFARGLYSRPNSARTSSLTRPGSLSASRAPCTLPAYRQRPRRHRSAVRGLSSQPPPPPYFDSSAFHWYPNFYIYR